MWRLLAALTITMQAALPGRVSVARAATGHTLVAIAPTPAAPAGARVLDAVPGDQPLRLVTYHRDRADHRFVRTRPLRPRRHRRL